MQAQKDDTASWRPHGLAEAVWDALVHRLWHATSIEGLRAILNDGCIRAVKENVGTKYRVAPLMLARGCVSLFDFGPTAGSAWLLRAQYRNWGGYLCGQYEDKAMIWLELDRDLFTDRLIPAGEVRKIAAANRGENVIPGIEAGHRGPVPLATLRAALIFYSREGFEHHAAVDANIFDSTWSGQSGNGFGWLSRVW
ncbi:MAG: hypothetical protein OXC14_16825 [Rhodospirillaceae bacterium]|nr:hypothetical protein [Rhodospirillaceae bacterium]